MEMPAFPLSPFNLSDYSWSPRKSTALVIEVVVVVIEVVVLAYFSRFLPLYCHA